MKIKKINNFMLVFIILSIIFVSISYSAFNTELYISGSGIIRAQADVRIINIENSGYYADAIENFNPNYNVDLTTLSVDLPTPESYMTYNVTIRNYGNEIYLSQIELLSEASDDVIITISDGTVSYNLPNDYISYKLNLNEEKTYTIKVSNKSGTVNNDIVVTLKYHFIYDIVNPPSIQSNTNLTSIELVTPGTSTFGISYYEYYMSESMIEPNALTQAIGITNGSLDISLYQSSHFYVWYRSVSENGTISDWSNRVEISRQTIKVTFNANGGNVDPTSKNVLYDFKYGALPTPTKNGYAFVKWIVDDVPNEYQKVEYIESSGSQWIDTGITLNSKYTFISDGLIPSGKSGSFIDGFESTSSRTGLLFNNTSSNRFAYYWFGVNNTFVSLADTGIILSNRFQVTQDKKGVTLKQGNITFSKTYSGNTTGTNNATINLLRQVQNSYAGYARIYDAKILDGDILLYHFIPCYRKSDNVVGVYETVNGVFYSNSNTSENDFTKGNNINSLLNTSANTITSENTVKINENHTLYAVWDEKTYTITLDNQNPTTPGTTSVIVASNSTMPQITIPTKNNYIFKGYYSLPNGEGTKYYNQDGTSAHVWNLATNATLYAKWELQVTTFLPGTDFNIKIKTIAGNNTTEAGRNAVDNNIVQIKRSNVLSITPTSLNIVSTDDSIFPIYAWYDNGILYYYSEDQTIYLNSNSQAMFYRLNKVESINFNNVNTSKTINMSRMFQECTSLIDLDLSNFNTENVIEMYHMFNDCKSIITLDLTSFNTQKVKDMTTMFNNCYELVNLNISSFNTENVTTMSFMFSGCRSLTTLNLSNFNTTKVTTMKSMFQNCISLTNLNISSFNTSNVTLMEYMFKYCESLTSLNLNHFNTEKVTSMKEMFNNCKSLNNLDISNFNTSNVTDMSYMFQLCNSLVSLNLSSFNTSKVTNMYAMFNACTALNTLNISIFNTSNVTNMGAMFYNCSSLSTLNIISWNMSKVTNYDMFISGIIGLNTEFTINNSNVTSYTDMMKMTSCSDNSLVKVNYTNATETLVDNMIDTKTNGCNIVKGDLVP